MKIISKGEEIKVLISIQFNRNLFTHFNQNPPQKQSFKHKTFHSDQGHWTGSQPHRFQLKSKGCFRCRNAHDKSASCPAKRPRVQNENTAARLVIMQGCTCNSACKNSMKQWAVHTTRAKTSTWRTHTPTKKGHVTLSPLKYSWKLTSTKNCLDQEIALHSLNSLLDKICATPMIN